MRRAPAVRIGVVVLALAMLAALLAWQAERPAIAALSALSGKSVASISAGASHTCAVTTDGSLACWGLNTNGQLGDGTVTNRDIPTAVLLTGPLVGKQFSAVAAGTAHTCAVTTDGIAACWGLRTNGRLGGGVATAGNVTSPTVITTAGTPFAGKQINRITTGSTFTCALATDGTLACWGQNTNSRLGDGTTTQRTVPTAVAIAGTPLAGATVAQVSAGAAHACAVTTAGAVACWGLNTNGRLGDNSTTTRAVPTAITTAGTPLDGLAVVQVATATAHTCAITSSGIAACWGLQQNGRLGNSLSTNVNRLTAVAVTIAGTPLVGKTIASIEAGATHTCVRATDATIACWGINTNGQLGTNNTTLRNLPTSPTIAGTALQGAVVQTIKAGTSHTCAVTATGAALCWGLNTSGQLGDDTLTQRLTAVAVIMSPTLIVVGISGQRTGVLTHARAGDSIVVSGSLWVGSLTSGSFTVTLGGVAATHTLSTDATGVLSGNVTVPAGAAPGASTLQVSQSTDVNSVPITVLGTRTIAATPGNGRPGTSLSVSGNQFDPNAAVQILGTEDASGLVASSDAPVAATISANGELAATPFVVNDIDTVRIVVRETAPDGDPAADRATTPFSIDPVTVTVASVTGQRAGITGFTRGGDTAVVAGSGWPSSLSAAAFTTELCTAAGTSCDAPTTSTLATDAAGLLSGGIDVPLTATVGARAIKVTQAGRSALVPIQVLGARTVVLVPSAGGGGTTVSVSGTDFDPDAAVTLQGINAPDGSVVSSDPSVAATIEGDGTLPATDYLIIDPATVAVMVSEDAPDGNPAADRAAGAFTFLPVTAVIDEVQGQRTGVTAYARRGDVLVVSGDGWAPNLNTADLTASLCAPDGSFCDAPLTTTLSSDGSGVLSGTASVANTSTQGERSLKVASANGESLTPVTVLGERAVTLAAPSVTLDEEAFVSASDFDPLANVELRGAIDISGGVITYSTDTAVTATTDGAGTLTTVPFEVTDPDTEFIVVVELGPDGDPAVDWASAPIIVTVPDYALGLRMLTSAGNPDPNTVAFGAIQTGTVPSPVEALLNQSEVSDDRGATAGWSLTASLTAFTSNGGQTIAPGQLSVSPNCSATPVSAPGYAAGAAGQTFDQTVVLCTKDEQLGGSGSTNGTYTIDAPLTLTVPAFQAAGEYVAVMTITLA